MKQALRIIARASALAQIQVKEVMDLLPEISYEMIVMESWGDKNKDLSLRDEIPSDFFTRELDEIILKGDASISIHSAKDLPIPLPQDLRVIALLPCYDATDALVTRGDIVLTDLPQGAIIATSSRMRQEALSELRDDLKYVDIRGTIEERILQIDEGYADAVIVATCALKRLELDERITEVLPIGTFPLQGNIAVVAHKNRPDLKKIFMSLDIRKSFGKVYLAGFGPGDPDLMTVKTQRLLQNADVILYDDLIEQAVIEHVSGEVIYVGKRKGQHYKSQKEINELIKEKALEGKTVLRLKGGDPCIFGRVGEEVQFLKSWMIPFEIIPGVTSVMAAAASQNISLTQRYVSKKISFLTAHHAEQRHIEVPKMDTIVYYMAASQLTHLKKRLLEEGRKANEPVLLVQYASFAQEQSESTTIGYLHQTTLKSPLMVIVGDVAGKAHPSYKILYTGLDPSRYHSQGRIVHYSLITTKALDPCEGEDFSVIARRSETTTRQCSNQTYEAIIFTSRQAVKYFFQKHRLTNERIIVIGSATEKALQSLGHFADHIAEKPDSIHLKNLIETLPYRSCLYPCSNLSQNTLHNLKIVTPYIMYQTEFLKPSLLNLEDFDEIVFTSRSTVDAFFALYDHLPQTILCVVLGPFTKQALLERGVEEAYISS